MSSPECATKLPSTAAAGRLGVAHSQISPKTRERRAISPAQLLALDSLLIVYLGYNSTVFTRSMGGPRSIIVFADSGMTSSFLLDTSVLDSKLSIMRE